MNVDRANFVPQQMQRLSVLPVSHCFLDGTLGKQTVLHRIDLADPPEPGPRPNLNFQRHKAQGFVVQRDRLWSEAARELDVSLLVGDGKRIHRIRRHLARSSFQVCSASFFCIGVLDADRTT